MNASITNTNFLVSGTHSKFLFIVVDNFRDSQFLNLISIDKKVPNRVEKRTTVYDQREYIRINDTIQILKSIINL